jgi:hypothetical protein
MSRADAPDLRLWRNGLRAIAVLLGAAQAAVAAARESMNADGMNYLDQGDAWWRADWSTALNAVWSPLYPVLQGAAQRLLGPSPRAEFAVVHLVNFLIWVGALACFEFFWRRVTEAYEQRGPDGTVGFPPRAWLCFGYALFVWSTLTLIEIWSVTPDMLVAAAVWLAAGLLVRIREDRGTMRAMLPLGAVLGLGYLAKAALFPMAFVFLVLAALVQFDPRRGWLRVLPAAALFVAIGGPLLVALSVKEGGVTFSEVGKLTYIKHVHRVGSPHAVPDADADLGEPEHPVRRLSEHPTVWEFAEPVGGTYPLSYDPYYWYAGLEPKVGIGPQLTAIVVNASYYVDFFVKRQGGLLALALVLCWLSYGHGWRARSLPARFELLLVALAGLAMYSVISVTWRYVAAFLVLLWAGVLTCVRLPDTGANRKLLAAAGVVLCSFPLLDFSLAAWEQARPLLGVPGTTYIERSHLRQAESRPSVAPPSRVAEALLRHGLQAGDRVGFVGYSYDAYWARLARLKIVAEILPHEADLLWTADPARREAVLNAFVRAGARVVVTDRPPAEATTAGWAAVGDTGYAIYPLKDL